MTVVSRLVLKGMKLQPELALIRGEGESMEVEDVDHPVIHIPAKDWSGYSEDRWPVVLSDLQHEIDERENPRRLNRSERRKQARTRKQTTAKRKEAQDGTS